MHCQYTFSADVVKLPGIGIISEDSLLLALRHLVFWTISSGSIMFNNLFFRNDAKVHETLDILQ